MSGVVISRPTMSRLRELPHAYDEVSGVLIGITRRDNGVDYFPTFLMTGRGSPSHVSEDPRRVDAVNAVLRETPDSTYIIFHTHTLGTIREFGDFYARNLSQGNPSDVANLLAEEIGYRGMLVTPVTERIFKRRRDGIEEIDFVVQDFPVQEKLEAAIQCYYERVRQRMGIPEFQQPPRIA